MTIKDRCFICTEETNKKESFELKRVKIVQDFSNINQTLKIFHVHGQESTKIKNFFSFFKIGLL